jgi:hypothetical protein
MKPEYNETIDTETVDTETPTPLAFKPNAWMQVNQFALQMHLDNLILTYGLEMVKDMLIKKGT